MGRQRFLRKFVIVLFWIGIWQLASMAIHNAIIFAGPMDVARSFSSLVFTGEFWVSIFYSLGRITLGFFTALLSGILFGVLSYQYSLLGEFLKPMVLLIKSIPVASFVILALIWAGSRNLSILISFLVVFPVIYTHTAAGLSSADEKMLEMARVFAIRPAGRVRCIYLPALLPYLFSGCETALGMAWKSGIAAEVIGLPSHSIGEQLYMAKIYLETGDVFAWTIVIILMSAAFEKCFLALLRKGGRP